MKNPTSTCLGINAGKMTTTAGGQKPECHGKAKLTKGYCEEWRSAEALASMQGQECHSFLVCFLLC